MSFLALFQLCKWNSTFFYIFTILRQTVTTTASYPHENCWQNFPGNIISHHTPANSFTLTEHYVIKDSSHMPIYISHLTLSSSSLWWALINTTVQQGHCLYTKGWGWAPSFHANYGSCSISNQSSDPETDYSAMSCVSSRWTTWSI